jgi:hypothetical protein
LSAARVEVGKKNNNNNKKTGGTHDNVNPAEGKSLLPMNIP